ARAPRIRKDGKPFTEKQTAVHNRFIDAALYAKRAISDEETKAAYGSKANINQTAYNVAFKDSATAPQVRRLDEGRYGGVVGDHLSFTVRDGVTVTEINVESLDQSEVVIESGLAQPIDADHIEWAYVATVQHMDYQNVMYRITM